MSTRPNVVAIVAYTFSRDRLGAYGNPYIHTLSLDAFARVSVTFDRHKISEYFGEEYSARVAREPLFDPENARPRRGERESGPAKVAAGGVRTG